MKKAMKFLLAAALFMGAGALGQAKAQCVTVNGNVDVLSNYIWRGVYQNSGVSIQPSLTISSHNFFVNVWGSESLSAEKGAQEFDVNLGYNFKNGSITLTDYWWDGIAAPYGHYKKNHYFEGTLAYSFGEKFPLSLSCSTMFYGGDYNDKGNRAYSTYLHAAYDFSLPANITLTPAIGFTPWKGMYNEKGAAVTDLSLTATKNIVSTCCYSIPVFIQALVTPQADKTYLVAGVGIHF